MLWSGRGTEALLWAYHAAACAHATSRGLQSARRPSAPDDASARDDAPEVIIPAICCPSVAHAATMSGLRVRVADVDPATGLLTAETARQRLTQRTCAVVFVHLFGQTTGAGALRALCDEHGLLLIEDAAQALGATIGQSPERQRGVNRSPERKRRTGQPGAAGPHGQPRAAGPHCEHTPSRGVGPPCPTPSDTHATRRTETSDATESHGRRARCPSPRSDVPTFPRSVGSLGDFCVLSFSRTKILPAGGGALIVRDATFCDTLRQFAAQKHTCESPLPLDRLARAYRDLTHRLARMHRLGAALRTTRVYARLARHFDPLFVRDELDAEALAALWPSLEARLSRRRELAELYARELAGGPWTLLDGWRTSGVCWRFSLLLDDPASQRPLAEGLRAAGFHVSTLYPPLSIYFDEPQPCPAAEAFWRRVLNLWVDESVDEAYVRRCAATLVEHARRLDGRPANAAAWVTGTRPAWASVGPAAGA